MKNYYKTIFILFLTSLASNVHAQLLFNETFDKYPIGHLNTDYTKTTVGQGGWLLSRDVNKNTATAIVTAEAGKGNVVVLSTPTATGDALNFTQLAGVINNAWNGRTAGNNILKFEYEFYGSGIFNIYGDLTSGQTLINVGFQSNLNRIIGNYWNNSINNLLILDNYSSATFPTNTWIKAEMYIDYINKKAYYFIPSLNIFKAVRFTSNKIPENVIFGGGLMDAQSYVKFDNIKLSAIKTMPTNILSNDEVLATKFKMYPNPVTNVVNITNSERLQVQQISVYDVTSKQLLTQSFNNETNIQLNVENLASGTYMLHLKTNEGIAVKKLVKK